MTDETTLACPECDSAPIKLNAPGGQGDPDKKYRCVENQHHFDEPVERETYNNHQVRSDTIAGKLDRANPDDFPPTPNDSEP